MIQYAVMFCEWYVSFYAVIPWPFLKRMKSHGHGIEQPFASSMGFVIHFFKDSYGPNIN